MRGRAPIGVLMVNLGSPDSPETGDVRRYLDEFLGDPLVVDANRIVWWFVRKLIILPFRGPKSAALYRSVWTPQGSPLIVFSKAQRDALAARLGAGFCVELAMRYGTPALEEGLKRLIDAGCDEVRVLSMFPQYSRTTTGTIEARLTELCGSFEKAPALRFVAPFFEDPGYVEALAARCREGLAQGPVDHVVFSFHGLPVRYVEAGDPYREHCERTAAALGKALELPDDGWSLVYQSRFGPEKWLEPEAARWIPARAQRFPRILVACPAFTADCLETLEEISIGLKKSFEAAGGEELRVVPCLNDHPAWVRALAELVRSSEREAASDAPDRAERLTGSTGATGVTG